MCDHEDSIIRVAFPRLVVGLGNPGPRYAPTRHNLGFRVVHELAAHLKLEFSEQDRAFLATPMATGPDSWVLMQPQTYMNLSGEAVSAWLDRHEVEPDLSRILVVCDDLALPLGHLRLRGKGTSGGQNGLLSIIEHPGQHGLCPVAAGDRRDGGGSFARRLGRLCAGPLPRRRKGVGGKSGRPCGGGGAGVGAGWPCHHGVQVQRARPGLTASVHFSPFLPCACSPGAIYCPFAIFGWPTDIFVQKNRILSVKLCAHIPTRADAHATTSGRRGE